MKRTCESCQHGGRYHSFSLLQRLVPLLNVIFEGQSLFAQTQQGHAELLLKAVVGRDALGVGEGRVAPPGPQDALGTLGALHRRLVT